MTRKLQTKDGIKDQGFIRRSDNRIQNGKRILLTSNWTFDEAKAKDDELELIKLWDKRIEELNSNLNSNMYVADALEWYYNRVKKHNHELRTYEGWMQSIRKFKESFSKTQLQFLDTDLLKSWAFKFSEGKSRSITNSSVSRRLMHLNKMLEYAVHEGVISKNPLPINYMSEWFGSGIRQKIANKEKSRAHDALSEIEIDTLRNYFKESSFTNSPIYNQTSKIGILISAFTGIRPGELQAIRESDIKVLDNKIGFYIHDSYDDAHLVFNNRTKTGNNRNTLFLPAWASKIVFDYISKRNEFLKTNSINLSNPVLMLNIRELDKTVAGTPITQAAFNKSLNRIIRQLQFNREKISMYFLRHTVASELAVKSNGDYSNAAGLMGHTITTFLETYVHAQEDRMQSIAVNFFN
ncbi:MAG: site-specific integrase [Lactobacillaceae bacterium]|jgi:integrase|nr:site-specific integrase [Lactobacillaceae bacterium]